MAQTLMQRIVEALPFLDKIGEAVQPEVQFCRTTVKPAAESWLNT